MTIILEMKASIFETGKSIQSFANMIVVVIFLKHFWDHGDLISAILGIVLWFGLYFIGIRLINWSEEIYELR